MERRKIQITGLSTYTLSLPKAWVVKNKLSAGNEVFISEQPDGTISLSPKGNPERVKRKIIHADEVQNPEELGRAVLSSYLSGYTTIEIRSRGKMTSAQHAVISKQRKRLIGIEVVEEDDEKVILQDFFSPESLSIERSISRAANISMQMLKDLLEALKTGNNDMVANSAAWEEEIDKIFFLIMRQLDLAINNASLMKVLKLNSSACLTFAFLIKEIEKISDHTVKLAEQVPFLEKQVPQGVIDELRKLLELSLRLSADSISALSKKENALANSVLRRQADAQKIREEISKKAHSLQHAQRFAVETMVADLCSIIKHSAEISEIGIDEISRAGN